MPEPVELILYVGGHSPRSTAALRNITGALATFKSFSVKLTVYDLAERGHAEVADSIALAPAHERSAPRTFILGHVSNCDLLIEMLGDCSLEHG